METRDRVVAAARDLFAERGYERTTLQAAAQRAGVLAGSVYHFFAKKSALLQAVLESYLHGLHPIVMAPAFSRTTDPIERIFEVLADYRERVLQTNFAYRCPIGSLALEVANGDDAARDLIAQNFLAWREEIERCLRAARPARDYDARSLAAFVLTVMEGAVMQSLALRSIEPFDLSIAELRTYLTLLTKGKMP